MGSSGMGLLFGNPGKPSLKTPLEPRPHQSKAGRWHQARHSLRLVLGPPCLAPGSLRGVHTPTPYQAWSVPTQPMWPALTLEPDRESRWGGSGSRKAVRSHQAAPARPGPHPGLGAPQCSRRESGPKSPVWQGKARHFPRKAVNSESSTTLPKGSQVQATVGHKAQSSALQRPGILCRKLDSPAP